MFVFAAALLGACASRGGGGGGFGGGDMNMDAPDAAIDEEMPNVEPDASDDPDPDPGEVLVYSHSRDRLYSFSPETLAVTDVGAFSIVGGGEVENILDIALDRDGRMFAVARSSLYRVNETNAELTLVGVLDFGSGDPVDVNALGFIAKGEYRDNEVLVGADNLGKLFEIDTETAEVTNRGFYPDGWLSSGDIVSIEGFGTYATVKRTGAKSDTLVKITFDAGGVKSVKVIGSIETADGSEKFLRLYGLGYWGDALYGFMADGRFISIDTTNAEASVVAAETGTMEFWGAGVTTRAPVIF